MGSFHLEITGGWPRTNAWLKRLMRAEYTSPLDQAGLAGVAALEAATPKRTGLTAESWDFRVLRFGTGGARIEWFNTNVVGGGVNVAIILQYGHGTGTGGYVQGIDYINPAMQPVFDQILEAVRKEMSR
jgi:hypothetical protein